MPLNKETNQPTNPPRINIHGTDVTANKSTNNNVVFVVVADLKIEYNNNY